MVTWVSLINDTTNVMIRIDSSSATAMTAMSAVIFMVFVQTKARKRSMISSWMTFSVYVEKDKRCLVGRIVDQTQLSVRREITLKANYIFFV